MFEKKKALESIASARPPLVNEILVAIIRKWQSKHSSNHVPSNPFDGANWWIKLQEPADEYRDRPEPITNKEGNHTGWRTPYHDRLAGNLKTFLALSEIEKAFVIDRVQAGIPWRGDKTEMYKKICRQHEIMMIDKDEYIGHASRVLSNMRSSN